MIQFAEFLVQPNHMLECFVLTQIASRVCICNFHGDRRSAFLSSPINSLFLFSSQCSASLIFLLFSFSLSSPLHTTALHLHLHLPLSLSVFCPSPSLSPSCPGDSIISEVHTVNCTLRVSWGCR
ncbi:hypothetical protein GOODEAATRI_030152 [Goodea atripinnis]|uniref:Uncharacterized protein n=1 Tax=Goodea atripinnis TaxID=208336 RepID=A0ABV0MZG0_9TELE